MANIIEYEDDGTGGWQPLAEGGYDFRITAVENIPAKPNQKANQLRVDMEVVESPDGNYIGKKAVLWVSQSKAAGWRMSELLEASGIEYEDLGEGRYRFDADELIGHVIYADVTLKTYNSKESNEFSNIAPSTYGQTPGQPGQAPAAQAAAPAQPAPQQPAQAQQAAPAQAAPATTVRRRGAQATS